MGTKFLWRFRTSNNEWNIRPVDCIALGRARRPGGCEGDCPRRRVCPSSFWPQVGTHCNISTVYRGILMFLCSPRRVVGDDIFGQPPTRIRMLRTTICCNMAVIRRDRRTIVALQGSSRGIYPSNRHPCYAYADLVYSGRCLSLTCGPRPGSATTTKSIRK